MQRASHFSCKNDHSKHLHSRTNERKCCRARVIICMPSSPCCSWARLAPKGYSFHFSQQQMQSQAVGLLQAGMLKRFVP